MARIWEKGKKEKCVGLAMEENIKDLPETLTNVYNNMGLVISSLTGVKCAVAGCPWNKTPAKYCIA